MAEKKKLEEKPAHLSSPVSVQQRALQALRHCGLPCDSVPQPRAQSHLQRICKIWKPQKCQRVLSVAAAQGKLPLAPTFQSPVVQPKPKSQIMSSAPSSSTHLHQGCCSKGSNGANPSGRKPPLQQHEFYCACNHKVCSPSSPRRRFS